MNEEIHIDGVTKEQHALLDQMWEHDSWDEYYQWKDSLTPRVREIVNVLEEMIKLAILDKQVHDENCDDAKALIKKIQKQVK